MTNAFHRFSVFFALAMGSNLAFAQTDLGPITNPVVPKPQPGLSDKAAPTSSGNAGVGASAAPVVPRSGNAASQPDQASDWQFECEGKAAARTCQALVRGFSGGQIVLVLSLAKASGTSEVAMQMALPLGLSIERGAELTVGDFKASLPISRCTAQGCLVESPKAAAVFNAIGKAEGQRPEPASSVTIFTTGGGEIKLPLPLNGAKAAFAAAGLTASQ